MVSHGCMSMRWDGMGWDVIWQCVMSCHVMSCHVILHVHISSCGSHTIHVARTSVTRVVLSSPTSSSSSISLLLPANNTALQSPQLSHDWMYTGTPYVVTRASGMEWHIPLCHSHACSMGWVKSNENDMTGEEEIAPHHTASHLCTSHVLIPIPSFAYVCALCDVL